MHLELENQATDSDPLASLFSSAPRVGLRVRHADGTTSSLTRGQLQTEVAEFAAGLDEIDVEALSERVYGGLYDGIDRLELDKLLVQVPAALIAEDPAYALLAARFLDRVILGEVQDQGILSFGDCIAHGHACGIIADDTAAFVQEHAQVLDEAILPERAQLFRYFGLRTVYDRYLLRHPTSRKVFETPQYFFMRVACGLARKPEEAIEFYRLLSSLEYLTAFVGLNSLLISVLLPIFFYLRLHRRLSGARAAALYALLALSVVLSVVIGYLDIAQYIASLSGEVDPSDPV